MRGEAHRFKQYLCWTATEKLVSWRTFAVFIIRQVTFASCQTHWVSYFSISTHVLHDPDAGSELKTAEMGNGGVPLCSPQLCFFPSLALFFSPLDVFLDSIVVLHCCATETLYCNLMMCVYCVPEIELMTVNSNCLQREMRRSVKHQKTFQR